jgi:hypothetical protein
MASVKFRFEDLEIWRIAIELAELLFDVADELETKKLFRLPTRPMDSHIG